MNKYSEKTAAAVLNGVLKEARKHARQALWYSWRDAEGRQCVVDGFRAFRLAAPLAAVEDMPENFATPVDLARVYAEAEKGGDMRELDAPKLADVEALIAFDRQCSSRERGLYMFGPGLPVLNVKYLRDALKLFPDARLYSCGVLCGVIVKSAHGDGLILPVRVSGPISYKRRKIIYNLVTFAARFTV